MASAAAVASLTSTTAWAVSSSELYTTAAYQYGRYEARMQFAFGDGVISSFFLWKDGSEMSNVFWNELDFEKLRANCELETNALFGLPVAGHEEVYDPSQTQSASDLCGEFHTYTYEWTPDAIVWLIDGVEIRRETGATAEAFRDNASQGMQLHFNVWPGDASFGGNFNPAILPLHQFINWVQYSSFSDGAFQLEWREDFDANTLPSGWSTGSWLSPKNLSTHTSANVTFKNGYAVLSLTADDATGSAGVNPMDPGGNDPVEPPDAGGTAEDAGTAPTPSETADVITSATPTASVPSAPSASSAAPTATTIASATWVPPPATTAASPSAAPPPSTAPMNSAVPTATTGATPSASPSSSSSIVQEPRTSGAGCACRVGRARTPAPWPWLGALLALSFIRVLRSARPRPR